MNTQGIFKGNMEQMVSPNTCHEIKLLVITTMHIDEKQVIL